MVIRLVTDSVAHIQFVRNLVALLEARFSLNAFISLLLRPPFLFILFFLNFFLISFLLSSLHTHYFYILFLSTLSFYLAYFH
jgi:hypothetical protein